MSNEAEFWAMREEEDEHTQCACGTPPVHTERQHEAWYDAYKGAMEEAQP